MSYFVAGLTNADPETSAPVYKQYRHVQYGETLPASAETTAPVYKQYRHVQYGETLPASAVGSVSFPPSNDTSDDMFTYVIIQQQFSAAGAICVTEVEVFLRGTELFLAKTQTFHHTFHHFDI